MRKHLLAVLFSFIFSDLFSQTQIDQSNLIQPKTYFSNVQKLDVCSGNLEEVKNARRYLDIIENSYIEILPKLLGKDSTRYFNDFKYVLDNYKWPIPPPWVVNNNYSKSRLIRTYFNLEGKKIKYQYQILVEIFPNNSASFSFFKNHDIIPIDNHVNFYFKNATENIGYFSEFNPTNQFGRIPLDTKKLAKLALDERDKEKYDEGLFLIEKCLWLEPKNQDFLRIKESILYEKGDYENLLLVYNSIIKKDWIDESIIEKAHYELGHYTKIFHDHNTKIYSQEYLESGTHLYYVGRAVALAENIDESMSFFVNSLKKNDLDYYNKYRLFLKTKNKGKALALQNEFLSNVKSGTFLNDPKNAAFNYFRLGLFAKSEFYANLTLKNKQKLDLLDQLRIIQIYIAAKKYNEAYTLSSQYIKIKDLDLTLLLLANELNFISGYLGKLPYEKSQKDFNEILDNNEIGKSQVFDCDEMFTWAKYQSNLPVAEKNFVIEIIIKAKEAINPLPQ